MFQRKMPDGSFDRYPKKTIKAHKSIPEEVARDYKEAVRCHDVTAPRAAVAMFRRALQSSAIERGVRKGDLFEQINELESRQIITRQLSEWAHTIRAFGNIGAHPDEDGLQDVTSEDADEITRFMEKYLDYVYVMPYELARTRERLRKMKKGATP